MKIKYILQDLDLANGFVHLTCFGTDLPEGMPFSLPISAFASDRSEGYVEGVELDARIVSYLPIKEYQRQAQQWLIDHPDKSYDEKTSLLHMGRQTAGAAFIPVKGSDVYLIRSLSKIHQLPVPVEIF